MTAVRSWPGCWATDWGGAVSELRIQRQDAVGTLAILDTLAGIYTKAYTGERYDSNRSVYGRDAFIERTTRQASEPGFSLVLGTVDDDVAGRSGNGRCENCTTGSPMSHSRDTRGTGSLEVREYPGAAGSGPPRGWNFRQPRSGRRPAAAPAGSPAASYSQSRSAIGDKVGHLSSSCPNVRAHLAHHPASGYRQVACMTVAKARAEPGP